LIVTEPDGEPAHKKIKGDAGVIYFSFDATLPNEVDHYENTLSSTSNIKNLDTYTIPESIIC
jgi:hypothetical protein